MVALVAARERARHDAVARERVSPRTTPEGWFREGGLELFFLVFFWGVCRLYPALRCYERSGYVSRSLQPHDRPEGAVRGPAQQTRVGRPGA